MQITFWERTTTVDVADDTRFSIDFAKLIEAAKKGHYDVEIQASGDVEREVTGEDILAICQAHGGQSIVKRDDSGLIVAIQASMASRQPIFEYDFSEMEAVLESLEAAGATPAPAKLLGDLAQTSVGTSGGETQVIGLAEWTIDWKRKTADATTTDDDTYESSLGSTASWSVKSKYMFIDGDPSQSTYILATITTPQSPLTWNFFPTIATGRAAFTGNAYVDGITIASGMGKVVGMDVSLKGTGQLKVVTQIAPVANPNTGTGQTAED